jgi:L-asparagine transporter-like permease
MGDATELDATPEARGVGQLRKTLRARHIAMISIGGIIGSGLFIQSSAAIAAVGPAIVVSYLLAGILVLFVMRMLAEMAAVSPEAGSFTEYIRVGLGSWAGFTSGWLYWYFWVLALALEALAGASILRLWIDLPLWQMGFGLLFLLTGVNLLSARAFGEAEFFLSSIKVIALLVFMALGAAHLLGFTALPAAPHEHLFGHGGFAPFGIGAILAGVTTVVFALVGAEIVTVAAAESHEPGKAIARLSTMLIVRIALFFVVSMLIVVAIVPWDAIRPGDSSFGLALGRIGLPWVSGIMNAIVLVAVLSCLNAGFYVCSRVLFVLAANSDAPAWMVRVNRRGVPARGVLVSSLVACIALIGSISFPVAIFSFLVNASGTVMLVIYLMLSVAQVRHRFRIEREAPQRLEFRAWLFPASSYAVIAAILGVLASMAFQPGLRPQLWAGLVLTGLVAVAYLCVNRLRWRQMTKPASLAAERTR